MTATAIRDRAWTRIVVHGAAAVGACLGFLFLISPTLFTNVSGIRRELGVQASGGRLGHPDLGLLGNMRYYVETYVHFSGVVLGVLALVGLAAVVARRRLDVLPWFTGLLVWVSLSALPMTWERWGLPMWTTPLLLASVGWCTLVDRLRAPRTRWIPWAVAAVVLVPARCRCGPRRHVADGAGHAGRRPGVRREERHRGARHHLRGLHALPPRRLRAVLQARQAAARRQLPVRDERGTAREVRHARARSCTAGCCATRRTTPSRTSTAGSSTTAPSWPGSSPPPRQPDSWFEPVSIWRNLRAAKEFASGEMTGPVQRIYRAP